MVPCSDAAAVHTRRRQSADTMSASISHPLVLHTTIGALVAVFDTYYESLYVTPKQLP